MSTESDERCPSCGRPRITLDPNSLCISVMECGRQGDDVCRLVAQRNTLVAALRRALSRPRPSAASIRAIGAVLEQIAPSPTWCPRCHRADVVVDGVVKVHPSGGRACGASTARVCGGIEIDDREQ